MDSNRFEDILGMPLQTLEIDTSEPSYHLDDLALAPMLVGYHSLDVSFGSREATVTIHQHNKVRISK